MKSNIVVSLVALVLLALLPSCKDQGEIVKYLQIVFLYPNPSTLMADKTGGIRIGFDRELSVSEGSKIVASYLDDGAQIRFGSFCGDDPVATSKILFADCGTVLKAGKTVQVTVPKSITDLEGNSLRDDITFRFTVATDSIPFDFLGSTPRVNDTVSIRNGYVSLSLSFTDFVKVRIPPPISTTPATTITQTFIIPGAQISTTFLQYTLSNVQANARYEVLIPREITDTEGDRLPQDYRIVFYTRP